MGAFQVLRAGSIPAICTKMSEEIDPEKMTPEELNKWGSDEYTNLLKNLEKHIKIVIGEDGCGSVYDLQQLKREFKNMVTNEDLRKFELKHKMFIDKDWEYHHEY